MTGSSLTPATAPARAKLRNRPRVRVHLVFPALAVLVVPAGPDAAAASPFHGISTRTLVVSPDTLALVPERIVDAVSDAPRRGVAVLVSADRILDVVPIREIPAGAQRVDLPGRTLLPGFIDAHTHLTLLLEGDWPNRPVRQSAARAALFGTVAA